VFYRLLCLTAHYPEYKHIRELVKATAMHILDRGGIVRNIDYWGTRALPEKMRRHSMTFYHADYWALHFDSNPETVRLMQNDFRTDPRVVKWTVLKLGHRAEDIVDPGGGELTREAPVRDAVSRYAVQLLNERAEKEAEMELGDLSAQSDLKSHFARLRDKTSPSQTTPPRNAQHPNILGSQTPTAQDPQSPEPLDQR